VVPVPAAPEQEVLTMPLDLEAKKVVVAEVAAEASKAQSAVGAEYRGLSVAEMDALRVEARKANVYLRVVKNTLARKAVQGTDFECIQDALVGPLALAFSRDDAGAAARVIGAFAKTHDKLVVKLVSVSGRLLPATDIERLATLPTREQALSQLMAVLKAPVTKLARTLAEPHAKLARLLAAVRDQKQAVV
jgi:large subunit ribosomal protein L10